MAIVKMQKLSICANRKNRKGVLETLQSLGCVEIIEDGIEDENLDISDTHEARARFEKSAESFDRVLKLLASYAPEKTGALASLAGPEMVTRQKLNEVAGESSRLQSDVSAILKDDREITECRGRILKDRNQAEALVPWMNLGIPMNMEGTKTTAVLIGTVPETMTAEALLAAASKEIPEPACISAEVLSQTGEMTCVTVVCLKKDRDKVEENLRSVGFARPSQPVNAVPADAVRECEEDIRAQEERIKELEADIVSYADRREDFRIAADYYRTRAEKYRVLGTIPQSKSAFFLEGWVPADQADRIAKLLSDRYGAIVEKEDNGNEEDEPTLLANNAFSRNVEGVLASYGLPKHGRVDPTFVMSIFYVIFFGMMLSDGGYGIVMAIGCAVLLKKYPRMAEGTAKMLKLFFWCGLSTAFWGFMYGGFFGDAIDTVAKTFFGHTGDPILKPLWFEPLKDPMRLLIYCMLFGLIHLFTGLALKGYEALMNHDYVGFFSDIVSWFLFIGGLTLMLIPSDIFASIAGTKIVFPPAVNLLAKAMAIIGALTILVMSGRGRRNWGLRIALGAYDIYGVSSWLSDVLSYSRLLALGLATGVIASVINMMASMGGRSVVGVIMFIVVFILGHTLNLAINALGAYVHTNRLQFVEFFGKFYDGGGSAFRPFKAVNKYIEVKEDSSL